MRIPAEQASHLLSHLTAADWAGRPLAMWRTTRPWLWATLIGISGTVFTAFGVGFSQVRHLEPLPAALAQAAFIGLSALVGLAVMWRTRPTLSDYGFRSPVHLARTAWLLPLVAVPVILVASSKLAVSPALAGAYLLLAVCVGFSEEIWFRGLLLATLRRLGTRQAIIGGSVIFGALHLTNLFAGSQPLYVGLQFAFACVVGFVLAEIVAITGSLWIVIVWHAVYDFAAFSTGDELTPAALAILAVTTPILVAYAVWLWRKLPAVGALTVVAEAERVALTPRQAQFADAALRVLAREGMGVGDLPDRRGRGRDVARRRAEGVPPQGRDAAGDVRPAPRDRVRPGAPRARRADRARVAGGADDVAAAARRASPRRGAAASLLRRTCSIRTEIAAAVAASDHELRTALADMMRQAQASGQLAAAVDPDAAAWAARALIQGMAGQLLYDPAPEEVVRRQCRWVVAALL